MLPPGGDLPGARGGGVGRAERQGALFAEAVHVRGGGGFKGGVGQEFGGCFWCGWPDDGARTCRFGRAGRQEELAFVPGVGDHGLAAAIEPGHEELAARQKDVLQRRGSLALQGGDFRHLPVVVVEAHGVGQEAEFGSLAHTTGFIARARSEQVAGAQEFKARGFNEREHPSEKRAGFTRLPLTEEAQAHADGGRVVKDIFGGKADRGLDDAEAIGIAQLAVELGVEGFARAPDARAGLHVVIGGGAVHAFGAEAFVGVEFLVFREQLQRGLFGP